MATPDFLSQLPSLDELLENPRVRDAVDRLNQSTAAARVRGALSTLTAEVGRAAENLPGLAPGEWVERLVSRLDLPQPITPSRVINATGDPFAEGRLPPLAPAAIEAMRDAAEAPSSQPQAPSAAIKLFACESATLAPSHAAALAVALEALASGGRVVVARKDLHEVAPGVRLDAITKRAGVTLQEVGATDAATVEDYASALAEPAEGPTLLLVRPTGEGGVDLAALAAEAKRAGAPLVVDAGSAPPIEATPGSVGWLSAEAAFRSGADLVLLDGAGLLGGPVAGLLLGRRTVVDRLTASPAAKALPVDRTVDAAVAATLALFGQPQSLRFSHPLYQLLDAPLEALRSRAERLAPQLAAGPGVESCEAVDLGGSWGVRLTGDAGLADRLASLEPRILGRQEGDSLVLDLRAVFPREDRTLVGVIAPVEATPA